MRQTWRRQRRALLLPLLLLGLFVGGVTLTLALHAAAMSAGQHHTLRTAAVFGTILWAGLWRRYLWLGERLARG